MSNVVTIDITAQSGEKVRKSFDRALATVSKFDKAMEKTERQMEKMARDTFQVCAQLLGDAAEQIRALLDRLNVAGGAGYGGSFRNFGGSDIGKQIAESFNANIKVKLPDLGKRLGTAVSAGLITNISIAQKVAAVPAAAGKSSDSSWEKLKKTIESAGRLLPGGEGPNMSSVIDSYGLVNTSMTNLEKVMKYPEIIEKFSQTKIGGNIKSVLQDLGRMGQVSGQNSRLSSFIGNNAGWIGAAAVTGGILGVKTLVSGAKDLETASAATSEEEKAAYNKSGKAKVAGTVIGTVLGFIVGGAPGAMAGAGLGGSIGSYFGDKMKEKDLLKIEQAKYSSQELKDALEAGVSDEEFAKLFQEIVEKDIISHFGKMKLSLEQIKKLASDITFNKQVKEVQRFSQAIQDTQQSLANVENITGVLEKYQWKAEIGIDLSEEDIQGYREAAEAYSQGMKEYLESSHYKATLAVELLVEEPNASYMLEGVNMVYFEMLDELQQYANQLEEAFKEAEKNGNFTDYVEKITEAQEKIGKLKQTMADYEEAGQAEALKIKYGGSDMDAESFSQLQAGLQEQNKIGEETDFQALAELLSSLEMRKDLMDKNGEKMTDEQYNQEKQAIVESFYKRRDERNDRIETYQLETIAENFKDDLDNISGEVFEANISDVEKLRKILDTIVKNNISLNGKEDFSKYGIEGLSNESFAAIKPFINEMIKTYEVSFEATPETEENIKAAKAATGAQIQEEFSKGFSVSSEITMNSTLKKIFSPSNTNVWDQTTESGIREKTNIYNAWQQTGNAEGGIVHGARISWIGEDGPEAIIPLGRKRRARGMSLWRRAGEILGYHSLMNYGYTGDGEEKAHIFNESEYSMREPVVYSTAEPNNQNTIQMSVSAAPAIYINGGQNEGDVVNTIRSHIRELADDMCGEIAEKITKVFSNMPQNA